MGNDRLGLSPGHSRFPAWENGYSGSGKASTFRGDVAQLEERCLCKAEVRGFEPPHLHHLRRINVVLMDTVPKSPTAGVAN